MTICHSEIEVIYLVNGFYSGRKYQIFESDKAEEIYMKTCAKYREGNVLVIMRKDGEIVKTYKPTKP